MNIAAVDNQTTPVTGGKLKWRLISFFMRTIGRTSTGIDLGYRRGFNSGVMLDKVYENRPSGKYGIGVLIDWLYLQSIGWRAIRARKRLLKTILAGQLEELASAWPSSPLVLADVAAGPGRYLLELCQEQRDAGQDIEHRLTVICRDLSGEAVERGQALAQAYGLANFHYETGDAVDAASLATITPQADIVVISGLYELFTDETPIKTSLRGICRILKGGGRLVFTTQVTHPQLDLIANVLVNRDGEPWIMRCRSIEEVEAYARESGFRVIKSEVEPLGLFAVTVCEKIGG